MDAWNANVFTIINFNLFTLDFNKAISATSTIHHHKMLQNWMFSTVINNNNRNNNNRMQEQRIHKKQFCWKMSYLLLIRRDSYCLVHTPHTALYLNWIKKQNKKTGSIYFWHNIYPVGYSLFLPRRDEKDERKNYKKMIHSRANVYSIYVKIQWINSIMDLT